MTFRAFGSFSTLPTIETEHYYFASLPPTRLLSNHFTDFLPPIDCTFLAPAMKMRSMLWIASTIPAHRISGVPSERNPQTVSQHVGLSSLPAPGGPRTTIIMGALLLVIS